MFKNFLQILALLTFLFNTTNVIASAPGIDEWRDNVGRPAPASIRRAADNLWTAVGIEGEAAFRVGWGIRKEKTSYDCNRVFNDILSCGMFECATSSLEYNVLVYEYNRYTPRDRYIIYEQKQKEVTEALQRF